MKEYVEPVVEIGWVWMEHGEIFILCSGPEQGGLAWRVGVIVIAFYC